MTKKILELIDNKKISVIKEELKDLRPVDIAEILDILNEVNGLLVFRLLSKKVATEVFAHLSTEKQMQISMLVREDELKHIIENLYFDDMIDYLEEMPANVVKKILKNTNEVERQLINQFLNYPDNSAGSLMTIEYVDLKANMTIGEALLKIQQTAPNKETIYTCYVTNYLRKMEGIISLKDLVLASLDQKVGVIMKRDWISVKTHDDQEQIASLFKKYDLLSMPVVDQENRLVGIITIDDVVDVIDEENTEDFHKMAAIQPSDEAYLEAGIFNLAKKRILWLLILMFSATFTGYIIRQYEDILQSIVTLAAFIPMLMGTGGNAGAQSASLVIRGIALGDLELKDFLKIIWRELRVSLIVGLGLAIINFLRIVYLEKSSPEIGLIVSLTLIVTITLAKIMGGILPLLAKSLGIDPAIMASPLISTIVDAITLVAYFSIAGTILRIPR